MHTLYTRRKTCENSSAIQCVLTLLMVTVLHSAGLYTCRNSGKINKRIYKWNHLYTQYLLCVCLCRVTKIMSLKACIYMDVFTLIQHRWMEKVLFLMSWSVVWRPTCRPHQESQEAANHSHQCSTSSPLFTTQLEHVFLLVCMCAWYFID